MKKVFALTIISILLSGCSIYSELFHPGVGDWNWISVKGQPLPSGYSGTLHIDNNKTYLLIINTDGEERQYFGRWGVDGATYELHAGADRDLVISNDLNTLTYTATDSEYSEVYERASSK